jgi:hypothetical protein
VNPLQQANEHITHGLEAFRVAGVALAERMRTEVVPSLTRAFEEPHSALTPTERKALAQLAARLRS